MILRHNPPGQPVRYVDLGPGYARPAFSGSFGGPIETLPRVKPMTRPTPYERRRKVPYPRCETMMPNAGTPCARRLGHADCHKTRDAVERDSARRKDRNYAV